MGAGGDKLQSHVESNVFMQHVVGNNPYREAMARRAGHIRETKSCKSQPQTLQKELNFLQSFPFPKSILTRIKLVRFLLT